MQENYNKLNFKTTNFRDIEMKRLNLKYVVNILYIFTWNRTMTTVVIVSSKGK
jgi:hypothetical protein